MCEEFNKQIAALIAENDSLRGAHEQICTSYNQVSYASEERGKQIDQLKAELEHTGYDHDLLRKENDQLKAENEALRKDAERYRWTCIEGNWVARFHGKWRAHVGEYGDKSPTDWYPSRGEAIDAAMGNGEQS